MRGVPRKAVQEPLGHATIEMTMRPTGALHQVLVLRRGFFAVTDEGAVTVGVWAAAEQRCV